MMCATKRLGRQIHRRIEPKGPGYQMNIVVDGLGNAPHTDFLISFENCSGCHEGPVSTDHKKDADVHPFQAVDNHFNGLRATG